MKEHNRMPSASDFMGFIIVLLIGFGFGFISGCEINNKTSADKIDTKNERISELEIEVIKQREENTRLWMNVIVLNKEVCFTYDGRFYKLVLDNRSFSIYTRILAMTDNGKTIGAWDRSNYLQLSEFYQRETKIENCP